MEKFIIVIEVDNVRAREAYAKGLHDLDMVMPQLMLKARERDDSTHQRIQEIQDKIDEKERVNSEYISAMNEWRASNRFTRGEEPKDPEANDYGSHLYMMYQSISMLDPDGNKSSLNSIRAELKEKLDLASAAIGPFRMTEHQVKEMVAWEDGSRIEQLKKAYT